MQCNTIISASVSTNPSINVEDFGRKVEKLHPSKSTPRWRDVYITSTIRQNSIVISFFLYTVLEFSIATLGGSGQSIVFIEGLAGHQ